MDDNTALVLITFMGLVAITCIHVFGGGSVFHQAIPEPEEYPEEGV